jgi:cation:H+ antiporter
MDILFYGVLLAVGIYLLVRASYYVIRSLSAISRYIGVSEFILSFLLLSLATSLSELTVGVNAAISGVPQLSLGDVLGTNLVNITLVLGLITILGKGVKLRDYKQFEGTRLINLLLVSAPFLLLIDGQLSRIDGVLLLTLFLIRIALIIRDKDAFADKKTFKETMEQHVRHTASSKKQFITRILIFVASSLVLIASAYTIVHSVTRISEIIGISEFIIGLFVVAIGTSLPELTVGLRAAKSGKSAVSVGNLFGAITINATLVLGVVSLIEPIYVQEVQQYAVTFALTIGAIFLVYYFLRNKHVMHAREGYILLFVYLIFLLAESASI